MTRVSSAECCDKSLIRMGSRIEGEEVETVCVVEGSYLFDILRDKGHLCASEKDSEREGFDVGKKGTVKRTSL